MLSPRSGFWPSAYSLMEERCGRQEGHPACKELNVGLLKGKIDHAQQ